MFERALETFAGVFLQQTSHMWLMNVSFPFLIYYATLSFKWFYEKVSNLNFRSVIELSGSVVEDKWEVSTKFSHKMKSVIHYINRHHLTDPGLRRLVEIALSDHSTNFTKSTMTTEYLIDQDIPLKLTEDICCRLKIMRTTHSQEKKSIKIKDITITVYSRKVAVHELRSFLNDVESEYDEYLNMMMNDNQFCFVYMNTDDTDKLVFNTSRFTSTKRFENLVSAQKERLIKRLDFFLKNQPYYEQLGIPYTFGLFLYGQHGCGKSSSLKAIANYTGRHIIIIPMTKVVTFTTLRQIILNDEIGGFKIPNNKRLYVFEEIDCNGMESVVSKRDISNNVHKEEKDATIQEFISKMTVTNVSEKKKPEDKITLGALLELLDGINEASGRILIMTSNRDPSSFDEALLRPGRIDMMLEFKKCTREETNELYHMWFGEHLPMDVMNDVREEAFSPAELGELFIRNREVKSVIWQTLKSGSKK